jgi:hypothetical protein
MADTTDTRELVRAFLAARQGSDADAADLMDVGFTFESPLMRFNDRSTYLEQHRAFQSFVRDTRMLSQLYGPDEATLIYDLDTATPAGVQRTSEHFRFIGGKVASIHLLFDSAPWRPIFGGLQSP